MGGANTLSERIGKKKQPEFWWPPSLGSWPGEAAFPNQSEKSGHAICLPEARGGVGDKGGWPLPRWGLCLPAPLRGNKYAHSAL